MKLTITEVKQRKEKPFDGTLGFGSYFTDHMFTMEYSAEKGWHNPWIKPYAPFQLDPSAMVFHYGQAIFEGMKAYRSPENDILLFRPEENIKRMNISCERMEMPPLPEQEVLSYLKTLVDIDREWVPNSPDCSLYIRPFMIATEPSIHVRSADSYIFAIILSPVGAYFHQQLRATNILVEEEYVRATQGGVGYAKAAGNYAGSFRAQVKAAKEGYDQVLWLDAKERKYIEEVGSMNIFFKVDNQIYTPVLNGSILDGITRRSIIHMLRDWGYEVRQEKVSMDMLRTAAENGKLEEVFGTGTAVAISPVGKLRWNNEDICVNEPVGTLTQKLYHSYIGIQKGSQEDTYHWTVKI